MTLAEQLEQKGLEQSQHESIIDCKKTTNRRLAVQKLTSLSKKEVMAWSVNINYFS